MLNANDLSVILTNQSIPAFQTISTQLAYAGYTQDITWPRGDTKFLFETVLTQDTFSRRTCLVFHCTINVKST